MFSASVARVNTAIMLHAEGPLTVAQVARASGLKYTPAASALATLQRRGLVRRVRRTGQDVFEPDRDDPHYPMAYGSALVDLPLAEAFRGQQVHAVFAYGSLAQPGGGTVNSDLDLLIVGDIKDRDTLVERLLELGARLGRTIDPFILAPEGLERARRTHDEHVESALAGVRILGSV
jgi:predicted nucleotidyltransferase